MLHYFGFTIQLVYATCFNVKVKKLAFDTSTFFYHKCMVFYEELSTIGNYHSRSDTNEEITVYKDI